MKMNEAIAIDDKRYTYKDYAPVYCEDCRGCSKCCRDMGDTIIQDPYDFWLFRSNMKMGDGQKVSFELMVSEDGPWELQMHDGLILPNIKMVDDGKCHFLNDEGRCSIHGIRSGLCRLYPLARVFEEDDEGNTIVKYSVLKDEFACDRTVQSADGVKIMRWMSKNTAAEMKRYEAFLVKWHIIKKKTKERILIGDANSGTMMQKLLSVFYCQDYGNDFWGRFDEICVKYLSEIQQLL